jgi:hypothetical protein
VADDGLSRLDNALDETERLVAGADTSGWTSLVDRLVRDCHPEQREFVLCNARYIAACIGRGGGKTTGGNVRFLRRMLSQRANCVFVAKTRKHAKTLIWINTKDLFKRLGFRTGKDVTYNETELTVTLCRNGSTLRLVGADNAADLDSLRGIEYNEVGIDEAASHPDALLDYLIREVIGMRLVGSLWLIGTAGKRLKGIFYEATRRGATRSRPWRDRAQHPDWRGWWSHKWSLESAIESTRDRPITKLLETYQAQLEEIAANGYSDENPIKRREIDAEWAADDVANVYAYRIHLAGKEAADRGVPDGTLWNQWDPERVGPLRIAKLPAGYDDWLHVIAIDPGFTDPTAINVFSVSPTDPTRTIYHRMGIERTKMHAELIAKALIGDELDHDKPGGIIGAIGEWPVVMVADQAHQMAQAILAELSNVYSLHIEPAQKGFRYKVGAIEVVNGDLVDGRLKVLKDSELEAQMIDLQWDETKGGELMERKSQPNHSTDSAIYARMAISKFISTGGREPELDPTTDPRSPQYVPPMPDESREDYSSLFRDDYALLLG